MYKYLIILLLADYGHGEVHGNAWTAGEEGKLQWSAWKCMESWRSTRKTPVKCMESNSQGVYYSITNSHWV